MSAPLDFEKTFKKFALQDVLTAARKGLGRAGFSMMRDAVMEAPTAPLDEGTLRGSGSVFVENELVATSEKLGQSGGTPATTLSAATNPDVIAATVGFNTAYALRLHEHPEFHFNEPGSGGKFLETCVAQNAPAYVKEVATTIAKELREVTPTS